MSTTGAVTPTNNNNYNYYPDVSTSSLLPSDTSVFTTNDFGSLQPGSTETSTVLNGTDGSTGTYVNPNNYTTSFYNGYGTYSAGYPTKQSNESDSDYQARVQQYQLQQIKNNSQLQQAQNAANVQTSATTATYTNEIKQLQTIIQEGKNDEIKEKLESIVNQYKNDSQYSSLNQKQIMALIEQQYPNLETDIEEKCSGSLKNGFIRTMSLGFCGQKTTKDDLLAYIRGTEPEAADNAGKVVGSIAGGAADGAAVGAFLGIHGAIAGAIIGGAVGGIKSIL